MNDNAELLIGQFEKNKTEEVRARLSSYQGHPFVDFRIFVTQDATGQRIPTKKGLAVRPDKLEALRDLVEAAIAVRDGKPGAR